MTVTQAVVYDASGTFPVMITDALEHKSHFRFDAGLGQITKALAPNGYLRCFAFDTFGRLEWRRDRGTAVGSGDLDTTACPQGSYLAHFEFVDLGDPTRQHILEELRTGGSELIESLRFFDGLGREYQSESESHKSAFEVVTRGWGSRGELACETLPSRRAPGQAPQPALCDTSDPFSGPSRRLHAYDPLLRPTTVTLAGASLPAPVTELTSRYAINAPSPLLGDLLVEERISHGGPSSPDREQHIGLDPRGQVVFLRDLHPGALDPTPTTLLTRDPKGRITRVDGPDVALAALGTDGNLLEIAYNAVDQRTSLRQPQTPGGSAPAWTYIFDLNGDLREQTSPRGVAIRFHRDEGRRLVLKDYAPLSDADPPLPSPGDLELTYHTAGPALGRLFSVTGHQSGFFEELDYDLRGRLTGLVREFGGSAHYAFGYTHDLLGRPSTTLLPDGGFVRHVYHGAVLQHVLSYLASYLQPDARLHDAVYHPSGGLEQLRFQSQHPSVASAWRVTETRYGYRDSDHRMETARTTLDTTGTPTVVQDLAYDHDPAGNLLAASDLLNRLDQVFSYDPLHRLESASSLGLHSYGYLRFEYDGAGNLLEKGPAVAGTGAAATGRLRLSYDRLGAGPAGVASVERHDGSAFLPAALYTQDADGSVDSTTKGPATTLFDRDDDGRIRSVREEPSGSLIVDSFHYDLAGERFEKIRTATALNAPARHLYYVDAGYEVDALNGSHELHLFAGGRRVATSKRPGLGLGSPATTSATAVEFYHPDHVGSNTLVSDSHGQVVQESFLTPFGELHQLVDGSGTPISAATSTTHHLFTDQEHDPETGLHYFGARYYDPWIGRFLSQDPELIGASPGITFDLIEDDPQHLNPYAYVLNRPTTLVDPTGGFEIFFDGFYSRNLTIDSSREVVLTPVYGDGRPERIDVDVIFSVDVVIGAGHSEQSRAPREPDTIGPPTRRTFRATINYIREFGLLEGIQVGLDHDRSYRAYLCEELGRCPRYLTVPEFAIPGNPFRGPRAAQRAFEHLRRFHGVDPKIASNRLHKLKQQAGLGPADDAVIGRTGDVYHPHTGERIGSLTDRSLPGVSR